MTSGALPKVKNLYNATTMYWRFKDEAKTIEIGNRFIVAPPWYNSEDRIKITLTHGYAFGTGVHETTAECISLLENLNVKGKSVLDVGTGTGILAIAASKLGASNVVAFDINERAVKECIENAALNKTDNINCILASSPEFLKEQFDIVLANIFYDIILKMSQKLAEVTRKGGYMILSGIIPEENFTVKSRFSNLGFVCEKNIFGKEYTTMLLRRQDEY